VLDQHAAVDGVAIVTGQLAAGVGTSALVAEWAVGKVQRVDLVKTDGTYKASVSPFLTGVKQPTAVIVSPEKTVLVGDWSTGKIYEVSKV
jgi:hypothetical protein